MSPFFALIGPDDEISPDACESAMRKFYEIALPTGDLTAAADATSPDFQFFLCSRILVAAALDYLLTNCRGREKQDRVERLTTEFMQQVPRSNLTLRTVRRHIRKRVRPEAFDFQKYAARF